MLTCPSDPLPQIVCPMDEDAIPPNSFCSAPPHSEPPPPLLPLSSITPSCANDGRSGHRRSGRIQGIKAQTPKKQSNSEAAQKPSRQNPSPTKRQRQTPNMVQISQSQPRVECTREHETQNEGGFDCDFAAEHQQKKKAQKSPRKKENVSAAEDVVEEFANETKLDLDTTKSDMDFDGGLTVGHAVENTSAPKGWVIGPLIQSFKSKMASFTEIVMSPVKLFRANSPPPSMDHPHECDLQADGACDAEHSDPSRLFLPEAQTESGDQDADAHHQRLSEVERAQNAKTVKYSKKLEFDVDLSTHSSEQADACAITNEEKHIPDTSPLKPRPLPLIVSEEVSEFVGTIFRPVSASHESSLDMSSALKEQKGKPVQMKPLPRKCTGNRKKGPPKTLTPEAKKEESDPLIDEQISHMNSLKADSSDNDKMLSLSSSVCYTQSDTDCLQRDGDDGGKVETCHLVRHSFRNHLNDNTNRRTRKSPDVQLLECQLNTETPSAAGAGRAKRDLTPDCQFQDSVKRKRFAADTCTKDTKKQELFNVASDVGTLTGSRPSRKEVVLTNTVVDGKETLKPARKRPAVSTRANKKGKSAQEILATINEVVLKAQTESSSDAMLVCSLDKSTGLSENSQKGSSSKVKPSGSCRRLKTRTGLGDCDVNMENSMDLETTVAITSTKEVVQDPLSEVLVRPEIKQPQSSTKSRNINKKPVKRKSTIQSLTTESDSFLVSTSSSDLMAEPPGFTCTDFNTSQHVQKQESSKTELNQPSKRPKKGFRGAVKSPASGDHETTKENQSKEGNTKVSVDPVYFEMTPFEGNHQPGPTPSQPNVDSHTQQNDERVVDVKEKDRASVADEVFSTDPESGNHRSINPPRRRSSGRRVNIKPRRADNQRRKCRVLHSRTRKGEEMTTSVTMDDADIATAGALEKGSSRRLLRSYSCPEIPSLHSHDTPWSSLHAPHHSRIHTQHQHQSTHTPLVHHAHKYVRRARRHTVCSLEVEREIAPLCLRKEVYPSRRSFPYDSNTHNLSPSLALSPTSSLSVLASCFLSSPLAFLSKKVDSRGSVASSSTPSHVSSPTSSSSINPLSPSTWRLPGFLPRADSSGANLDTSSSGISLECEIERRQQSEEEDDGEDTSSSSQEFEDVALREEKALSDSEIKVVQKHEERGKVSSIRIRKTLPKPQNNLTPMGLPKPIRLKKKEFSLEEIYTNKNFSKPPESRLETIFEVPLNRRNGSESWFGQRRVKRFLEFLEVGEARKPKKPLVGAGKAVISSSRTRRSGFAKDEPSLSVQDVDSLLCAKLDQLKLWLMHDERQLTDGS